jgi:hypothetical protein
MLENEATFRRLHVERKSQTEEEKERKGKGKIVRLCACRQQLL